MAGIGYDDNVCFGIELTGTSIGERGLHLFTARHDLKVRLMWNRAKLTDAVTKADVVLEQVGKGYDSLSYSGSDKLEVENGGKTVRWFQHTILFEIHFSSVASPIAINLGQTLKLDGLDKINSIYSITLKGWYDLRSGASDLEVFIQ